MGKTGEKVQIQLTTKYSIFNVMEGNRTVNKTHVGALKNNIVKHPTLTQVMPILVNEKMEVVDGQHRLQALQELGMPVYYIKAEGATLSDVITINTAAKRWGWMDYAHSHASLKNENYITYLEFASEYGSVGHKTLILALNHLHYDMADYKNFKEGRFVVSGDLAEARSFLSLVQFCITHFGVIKGIYYPRGLAAMYPEPNFSTDILKSQLLKWGYELVPTMKVGVAEQALRRLYNKGLSENNQL